VSVPRGNQPDPGPGPGPSSAPGAAPAAKPQASIHRPADTAAQPWHPAPGPAGGTATAERAPPPADPFLNRLDLEPARLGDYTVDTEVVHLLPEGLVRQHQAVPVCIDNGELVIAMAEAPDLALLDQLELVTGYRVRPVEVAEREIRRALERFFTVDQNLAEGLSGVDLEGSGGRQAGVISLSDRLGAQHDAPAVRLVDTILRGAARRNASDIHIEPEGGDLLVRYRLDGVLHDMMRVPGNLQEEVISRTKLISGLDITEHRLSQDGRISVRMEAAEFDMRVSTVLTVDGEKIAIRLLNKSAGALSLTQLGMTARQLEVFNTLIRRPYGMIILAGPTGSGKTTTLYAALKELDRKRLNITTVEDPVEYSFDRVNQIQVNAAAKLTFASALRTVLRQDPDIIMVGEIRDHETSRLAVQAAMTGHVVFSTLHANDASSVMNRLKDLEVPPFLIGSTVVAAISQRLVRRICTDCAEPFEAPPDLLAGTPLEGIPLKRGAGCDLCLGTGYRGRLGIFEILPISEEIRDAFQHDASSDALRAIGRQQGFFTMRDSAIEAVRNHLTTVDEVRRILPAEELKA
jgi:type IV pilus assembly protein PilB